MKHILKLAGTAATVLLIAALGSLNIPGIILSTLALNAICGVALKRTEVQMEKFVLKNEDGQPVFIQQKGNLTKPTVRLTPTTFQWIKMLSGMANLSMGSIVEQCVDTPSATWQPSTKTRRTTSNGNRH